MGAFGSGGGNGGGSINSGPPLGYGSGGGGNVVSTGTQVTTGSSGSQGAIIIVYNVGGAPVSTNQQLLIEIRSFTQQRRI